MSETREQTSFITTPLEFFGHTADEIHFGYPKQYYDQLERSTEDSAEYIEKLERDRRRIMANETPLDERYQSDNPDVVLRQLDAELQHTKRRVTQNVNHEWYERRFRGRYASHLPEGIYPEVEAFEEAYFYKEDDEAAARLLPATQQMAGYLNEKIRLNEWRGATLTAKAWYDLLDDDNPDKAVARDYFGFAGNIILFEYASIAIKLAEASTADDDFVSVKHLVTVCWPMTDLLQDIIPEEVAKTRQVLREAFLQMAARGSSSLRMRIDMFATISLGMEYSEIHNNPDKKQQAYKALFAFENQEGTNRQQMYEQVTDKARQLAEAQRWSWAIDMLDIARYSFGFDEEPIQEQIDAYAIEAANHYLKDMAEYDKPWSLQVGKYEHPTCNRFELSEIKMAEYVSSEVKQQIYDMENNRQLEYKVQALQDNESPTHNMLWDLVEELTSVPKETAARYGSQEVREMIMDLIQGPATDRIEGSALDHVVESTIALTNIGIFSKDDMELLLYTLKDKVLRKAHTNKSNAFEAFMGYISPILRVTKKTEKPDDEIIWRFLSKSEFKLFMERLITLQGFNDEDTSWYEEQQDLFTNDIRGAWNTYWDAREDW